MDKPIYKSIIIVLSFLGGVACMIILGMIFSGCTALEKKICGECGCGGNWCSPIKEGLNSN